MIFRFSTDNSIYEVDPDRKLIRRLAGVNAPTPSQGADGEWKVFERIDGLEVGYPSLIRYPNEKGTLTSVVRSLNGAPYDITEARSNRARSDRGRPGP